MPRGAACSTAGDRHGIPSVSPRTSFARFSREYRLVFRSPKSLSANYGERRAHGGRPLRHSQRLSPPDLACEVPQVPRVLWGRDVLNGGRPSRHSQRLSPL